MYKSGKRYKEIADLIEVHFETVGKWVRAHRKSGIKEIQAKTRGRKHGTSRRLVPEQETLIQTVIVDKPPGQLKMGYALWTRQAVKQLKAKVLLHMRMLQKQANRIKEYFHHPKIAYAHSQSIMKRVNSLDGH